MERYIDMRIGRTSHILFIRWERAQTVHRSEIDRLIDRRIGRTSHIPFIRLEQAQNVHRSKENKWIDRWKYRKI